MPQYGLVQAATSQNTTLIDVNGDGGTELVIADQNFVRACAYEPVSGWRVVEQITISDPGTELVGVTAMPSDGEVSMVAADKGNSRLIVLKRHADSNGNSRWRVTQHLRMRGFSLGPVIAGQFGPGGTPAIIGLGSDAFALVRPEAPRFELKSVATMRSESEDRIESDIESGDVNNDGFTDVVVLDIGERMCVISTFSATRQLLHATEFEVFQSRQFNRPQNPAREPRSAMIADVTGDGLDDIVITVHDRVIIYPQSNDASKTKATAR
jgi:hypothetical protein